MHAVSKLCFWNDVFTVTTDVWNNCLPITVLYWLQYSWLKCHKAFRFLVLKNIFRALMLAPPCSITGMLVAADVYLVCTKLYSQQTTKSFSKSS